MINKMLYKFSKQDYFYLYFSSKANPHLSHSTFGRMECYEIKVKGQPNPPKVWEPLIMLILVKWYGEKQTA